VESAWRRKRLTSTKVSDRDSYVRVGLHRDEFLFANSAVIVETRPPMDPREARKAIGVLKSNNRVTVSKDGRRATWAVPEDLPVGRHVLQIGPLLSNAGGEIGPKQAIPFQLVRSRARIPRRVAVESFLRAQLTGSGRRIPLGVRSQGKYVEFVKASDRRTGAPVALAFDETGRRVNSDRILRAVERERSASLGKLHEDLFARLRRTKAADWVHVAIWAEVEDEIDPDEKRGLARAEKGLRAPRFVVDRGKVMLERARRVGAMAEELGARRLYVDEAAPVVFARLRPRAIRMLAERDEVAGIFLYDPEGIEDLDDSIDIANSDDVHSAGPKGSGVRVAVWENGPDDTDELVIEDEYTSSPSTSDHARLTHAIVKNKEEGEPHGHAPECTLYSANSKDLAALSWAVRDRNCTVVNQSFHRSSEPESGSQSFDDIYKDWLALHWPYPTIFQAAGNFWSTDPDDIDPPSDEFVNHKGYNSLAVGNHDDSAAAMSSTSVFRNPTSSHGDRELPEIAANGTSVRAVGHTDSGTSFASPAVAGIAALLQSAAPTLRFWPEGGRAILMAGATRNVAADTWWQDVADGDDASDGSGAANALESYRISQWRRRRNAAPTRRGWDIGTLSSSDFDPGTGLTTFSYRIQVPDFVFGPKHVKVALAWDSKVKSISIFGLTIPLSSQLTVDLDLKVFDSNGTQVGYSGSWDNSYEIAEFDAIPGKTYDIKVRRWSGTDWTWYGIAWTVSGGLLDLLTALRSDSLFERA
jgi:Subtilase family